MSKFGLMAVVLIGVTVFSQAAYTQQKALRPVDSVMVEEEPSTTDKIVGGKEAPSGKFPFQVALIRASTPPGKEQKGQFCGGTLIANRWVLTAAHCVPQTMPKEVDIYVGSQMLPTGEEPPNTQGARLSLAEIIVHENYIAKTHENDIALLKLIENVPPEIRPVNAADALLESELGKVGSAVTVIGWGRTKEGGVKSPVLNEVEVTVQDRALCQTNYDKLYRKLIGAGNAMISENMFCAGKPEGGVDSCQADSGGFIGVSKGSNWIQLGIVSWGVGCARPELFGVYTRVANYSDWIREIQQSF